MSRDAKGTLAQSRGATSSHRGPLRRFASRFLRDKAAVSGAAILLMLVLLAAFPELVTFHSPTRIDVRNGLALPSSAHPLGTDELGRDVWSRVVHGTRVSLLVATAGGLLAALMGIPTGVLSGYLGGRVDAVVMRALDVVMAFPAILLALMLIAAIGPGTNGVILAVGMVYAPRFARVARGAVLATKELTYVEAARAAGNRTAPLLARHILPNIAAPVSVLFSVSVGMLILVEATLSFLGLGVQPPNPSWGYMLSSGKDFMELSPWPVLGPGLFIMLAVMGFNLLGDGLQDVTSPRK